MFASVSTLLARLTFSYSLSSLQTPRERRRGTPPTLFQQPVDRSTRRPAADPSRPRCSPPTQAALQIALLHAKD